MRSVLLAVCLVLSACGGGGAPEASEPVVQSPVVASPSAPAQQPAAEATSPPVAEPAPPPSAIPNNIAAWGDSLTGGYSFALSAAFPDRTVYNGGVGGQTSSQTLARILADTSGRNAWVNVFWMGRNNYAQADQVRSDIAAAVANLATGNEKFTVLSVLNTAKEPKGTAAHTAITSLNASLAALYAGRYLDIRSYLVEQFDPMNPQDVADHAADVVPGSLRLDDIHLNARGNELAAAFVRSFLIAESW